MRYVIMVFVSVIALGMVTGCTDQSSFDARATATYLDGKVITDKEGCVYTVSQYGGRGNATVLLRLMPELSADTCTFRMEGK